MGLKLGKLLKKVVKVGVPAAVGFATGGAGGAFMSLSGSILGGRTLAGGGVGAGVPSIEQITGAPPLMRFAQPVVQRNGGVAVPVAAGSIAPLAMGMSRAVISAIMRLGASLGIAVTASNIGRIGMRLWTSVMALARRHPGTSIIVLLTGLGLLAEEAAEFLFWGQAKKRRRRGRGISARDIRVSRRTIRKMAAMQRDLGRLPHHHPRGVSRRGGGVSVVRAG